MNGVEAMRKTIISLIILSFCMSISSCGNKNYVESQGGLTEQTINSSDKTSNKDESVRNNVQSENNTSTGNGSINKTGKDIYELIPKGWHILEKVKGVPEKVEGDLNEDGVSDIAAIIEEDSHGENSPARAIIIAFGTQEKTYTLSINSGKAVLKSDEGGVFGDPFESLSINRGSILLTFYGGSNWRWYSRYRFRFQDNGWYLIGATLGSYFTGTTTEDNADEEDYNLLTGDYTIKKADEKGNMMTTKGNRGKKELVNLKDFVANSEKKQF